MNEKPPPPPSFPPPSRPAPEPWQGGDEALNLELPPSSGGVIALGILNIIFALVCGCTHGSISGVLSQIGEQDQEVVFGSDWAQQMDGFYEDLLDEADSDEERVAIAAQRDFMKSEEVKVALREVFSLLSTSELGQRLQQASTAGLIVQLLMLVSGALLLARVRISRALGLAATFLSMLVQVTLLVFLLSVVDELELALGDRIVEAAEQDSRDFDPAARDLMEANVSGIVGETLRSGAVVATIVAILYPLIAFIFLLCSRGIRRALGDDGRASRPDVF